MLYGLDAASGATVCSVNVGAAFPAGARWGAGIALAGLAAADGLLVALFLVATDRFQKIL